MVSSGVCSKFDTAATVCTATTDNPISLPPEVEDCALSADIWQIVNGFEVSLLSDKESTEGQQVQQRSQTTEVGVSDGNTLLATSAPLPPSTSPAQNIPTTHNDWSGKINNKSLEQAAVATPSTVTPSSSSSALSPDSQTATTATISPNIQSSSSAARHLSHKSFDLDDDEANYTKSAIDDDNRDHSMENNSDCALQRRGVSNRAPNKSNNVSNSSSINDDTCCCCEGGREDAMHQCWRNNNNNNNNASSSSPACSRSAAPASSSSSRISQSPSEGEEGEEDAFSATEVVRPPVAARDPEVEVRVDALVDDDNSLNVPNTNRTALPSPATFLSSTPQAGTRQNEGARKPVTAAVAAPQPFRQRFFSKLHHLGPVIPLGYHRYGFHGGAANQECAKLRHERHVKRLDDAIWRVSRFIYRYLLSSLNKPDTAETLKLHERNFAKPEYITIRPQYVALPPPITMYNIKRVNKRFQVPKFSEVFHFIRRITFKAALSCECIVISLIYVEKVMCTANVLLKEYTWRPIVISCLLLASKVWEDLSSWNVEFAEICSEFPLKGINQLERILCNLLDFTLHIEGELYAKYYFCLKSLGPPPWILDDAHTATTTSTTTTTTTTTTSPQKSLVAHEPASSPVAVGVETDARALHRSVSGRDRGVPQGAGASTPIVAATPSVRAMTDTLSSSSSSSSCSSSSSSSCSNSSMSFDLECIVGDRRLKFPTNSSVSQEKLFGRPTASAADCAKCMPSERTRGGSNDGGSSTAVAVGWRSIDPHRRNALLSSSARAAAIGVLRVGGVAEKEENRTKGNCEWCEGVGATTVGRSVSGTRDWCHVRHLGHSLDNLGQQPVSSSPRISDTSNSRVLEYTAESSSPECITPRVAELSCSPNSPTSESNKEKMELVCDDDGERHQPGGRHLICSNSHFRFRFVMRQLSMQKSLTNSEGSDDDTQPIAMHVRSCVE